MLSRRPLAAARGSSMIEVLVTMVVVAFGLLGLAGLQIRMQGAEMESYQRGQALVLLNDMSERIAANSAAAAAYAITTVDSSGNYTGYVGASPTTNCNGISDTLAKNDCIEWQNHLLGATETQGTTKVGAMIDARGCIIQVQAPDSGVGVCKPGIYEVSVAWQGLAPTAAPALGCARGTYGVDDGNRRLVSARVTVGLPGCS